MRMSNAAIVLVLLLAVASRAIFAAQHVVGGSVGWSKATDYAAWAATKPFTVGDTLVFNYGKENLVYEVSEDDYKNCTTGKPMQVHHSHSHSGGQTFIPLDKPGPRYFLSPTFGHCASGMKLAINVKPLTTSGTTGGTTTVVTDQLMPPVIPTPIPLPPALPSRTFPGGGGGGGGLSPPIIPFIYGPPDPYGPYHPHGGAAGLGKMSIFTIGFYSLLVLIFSFLV